MATKGSEESVARTLTPERATSRVTLHHVPLLMGKHDQGINELESMLLAWALILYRHNHGNRVQFCWGLCEAGASSGRVYEFDTSSLPLIADDSLTNAVEHVHTYLQNILLPNEGIELDRYTFFFNDEHMPVADASSNVTEHGNLSMTWGNIQLQADITIEGLRLHSSWRQPLGAEFLATHFAETFVEMLRVGMSDLDAAVRSTLTIGEVDKTVLWNWNKELPPTTNICIHDLIANQVREQPNSPAISGWDGDLTYAQVEQYSTAFVFHLLSLGLQAGNIVPLCFEKSRWTTIAVMAVIKAGGAFVLMDPSQPIKRRQIMAKQVDAKFILTSKGQSRYGQEIAPEAHLVVVDEESLTSLQACSPDSDKSLPVVRPESLLYVIFTSGSTGTPKGVMISHSVYSTSALARSGLIGYSKVSRSLDFTSYAFDVSVDSILSTLLQGGCLCIPSDMDRINDLSGAIRRLGVNMVNITPSVARILDPDIIPSLNSLGIGGESCSAGDIAIWGQNTRVVIGYGPAECTIGCTVNPSAAGKPYVSVGAATGAVIWLVDPDDRNKLVPIGAVGELLIEGPIVGEGYLGDPEKTAAAFIHDPKFLLEGGGGIPGRQGRLYKTGDLVRYDPDGERGFVFVGRKDTQIKLRGQRVELGEIEHHIKKHLPSASDVVVEIIAPRKHGKESMLVAFISDREAAKHVEGNCQQIEFTGPLQDAVNSLNEKLSKALPVYMVPAAYICLSKIPMLVSGKTDRKTLRAMDVVNFSKVAGLQEKMETREPKSEAERVLHAAWCSLLALDSNQVGMNHNFFILGGESVLAMKLVPILRELGYILSVADVFNCPVLADMANAMQKCEAQVDIDMPAFSLLKSNISVSLLRVEAADQCGCSVDSIEDIYPCAPMQEIHMAFYTRSKENYVAQRVADIHESSPITKIKSAWNTVVQECSILRTRIVEFKQHGFMQVVISETPQWKEIRMGLDEFLARDAKETMSPGQPLSRFAIVHDEALNKSYLVWTAHHAIYDGWSTDLIVEHAKAAYHGLGVSRPADFRHFIQYLADPSRRAASEEYWRAQLEGATGPQFPSLPSRSYIPDPTNLSQRLIKLKPSESSFTIATIIRAAWALLASQYSFSDDVVFGETFTGRTIPVIGIEQIEGPILATLPVRIRIDRTTSIQDFLGSIQEQSMVRAAHEHLGIQHIRRLSNDAQIECEVTMGLVIQPQDPDEPVPNEAELPSFRSGDAALEALHFNSYPIMLACSLQQHGFRLLASFDSALVTERQIQRLLSQFEHVVYQLRGDQTWLVGDLEFLPQEELFQIWEMNREPPVSPQHLSRFLSSGDKYPTIQYNSWVVNTANPDSLMPIGAAGELLLESAVLDTTQKVLDAPKWLQLGFEGIPGRQGRLHHTGDIVRYADDMSVLFLGRKDAMTSINGHVLDLNATQTTLKRLLPKSAIVSCQIITPSGSGSQKPLMVAFVQEIPQDGAQMVELGIESTGSFPLARAISVELATAFMGLNKILTETLPPYAIPSVYIPLSNITDDSQLVDVTLLNGIAENVTVGLVTDVRKSINAMRQNLSQLAPLTTKEKVLRSFWAKFLGLEEDKIVWDDNFFRLGGDSIVAMRMVSALRQVGYRLSVASIFENMQLRGMADALEEVSVDKTDATKEYSAFSLLNVENVDSFLSGVQSRLAKHDWVIQDVLPALDPQRRDVESTVFSPRSSVQYNMLYLDNSIDTTRLVDAFQSLVAAHPILRTVFIQDQGQTWQIVLKDVEVPVTSQKTNGCLDVACKDLAKTDIDIESEFALGASFLRLFILQGDQEKALMIRISHAQYDGVSLPELLSQLEKRYRGLDFPTSSPFETYINYLQHTKAENIKFWRNILHGSSPTTIISPAAPQSKTCFITKPVEITACSPDTTLPILATAAWACVLSRHLNTADVTFGSIVSGRDIDIAGVDTIMGPCYQYMPIRVNFDSTWTAKQLLDYTRKYFLRGSEKATLGFQEILHECTTWPSDTEFYGSFLNHLNREYFDTVPFAETTCRVDYIIPHPEPPAPPRIVSFTESNRTYVGIEADQERRKFWESMVEELSATVEEFVKSPCTILSS